MIARDAEMSIKVDIPAAVGEVKMLADRDRVLQAIGNLVGNALRYARGRGDVELTIETTPEQVLLCVSDRGPGIDEEALPHIFDHYWQAHRQRRAGAGLGLAIVQGIAVAHGGAIRAENREGGGARFCLGLPAAGKTGA
jgi:signal transduction histidine kinase